MVKEVAKNCPNGIVMFLVLLAALAGCVYGIVNLAAEQYPNVLMISALVLGVVLCIFLLCGLFTVAPNQGRVLQLFGRYMGTCKDQGLRWTNPFYSKEKISLRVRNFDTDKIKVNDSDGNPIEIGAVIVWKVVDTAEAMFEVDDYVHFVRVQSESALRNLATHYPYDAHDDGQTALRSHTNEIAEVLQREIQERLTTAGVRVLEARISHLAYSPEIASAMLQRQQASAIIAARQKIVEGAVGMVEMALDQLSQNNVVDLDEERKASMVSNLLVVLCGDRSTQPVVNAGTLYSG